MDKILECGRNTIEWLKSWKRENPGVKVIGINPIDTPEELIEAAGLHPYVMLTTDKPVEKASAYLIPNTCSFVRGFFDDALTIYPGLIDGYIISQVCDLTRTLSCIWKENVKAEFVGDFLIPKQTTLPSARDYLRNEFLRIKKYLEEFSGNRIENEKINERIALRNRLFSTLKEIYKLKRERPGTVGNTEFFSILRASMVMPREEALEGAEKFLEEARKREEKDDLIPVMLSGITIMPLDITDYMDEIGFNVVCDDLICGSRYIDTEGNTEGDAIENLVDRHFRRPPFTSIFGGADRIQKNLLKKFKEGGAEGVIYLQVHFCESQSYDLPDLKAFLRENSIPFVVLEVEHQSPNRAQLKTRLQAFYEMLKEGGVQHGR